MDIQTRKIEFIQQFLKLKSEKTIMRLEKLLKNETSQNDLKSFEPMSINEFNQRLDQSMEDSKNDRLVSIDDLKSQIAKWD